MCTEYYFLNIKTCQAAQQGNEIFFRNPQLKTDCCLGISSESSARISGQGQPSHLPIFSQNLIIFPRSASHFLSIALKELQGQDGRELITWSCINDKIHINRRFVHGTATLMTLLLTKSVVMATVARLIAIL